MASRAPIDPSTLFRGFAGGPAGSGALRERITAAFRLPEPAAVAGLLPQARMAPQAGRSAARGDARGVGAVMAIGKGTEDAE